MTDVEVVVAHSERATLRVGDVFLEIDADQTRADVEVDGIVGRSIDTLDSRLASECEWLVANDVLPAEVVTPNQRLTETAFRPSTPVFIHGDLQVDHISVAGDEVTGIIDWSEASQGDALFDIATLTLGHPEHLGDVIAGYGIDIDRDRVSCIQHFTLCGVQWLDPSQA